MVCEWVAPLADFFFFCLLSILVPKARRFFWLSGLVHYKLIPVALAGDENGSSRNPSQLQQTFVRKEHVTKP